MWIWSNKSTKQSHDDKSKSGIWPKHSTNCFPWTTSQSLGIRSKKFMNQFHDNKLKSRIWSNNSWTNSMTINQNIEFGQITVWTNPMKINRNLGLRWYTLWIDPWWSIEVWRFDQTLHTSYKIQRIVRKNKVLNLTRAQLTVHSLNTNQ